MTTMPLVLDDGGRAAAGFAGKAGDCVCRSIAIVSGRPYREVYDRLAEGNATQRATRRRRRFHDGVLVPRFKPRAHHGVRTASHGINTSRKWFRDLMREWGFRWVPTMSIGSGCTVNLRQGALPAGRLVVQVSKHYTAVLDGVLHDTHDPSRSGTRCVYGYWVFDGGAQ